MKQWAKTLLERFTLSHIRWLIIGVLLTEFITWLLYKNPKKITAPGVSAMVAVCALILAVYSAYQVKKWVNGKVNDKGFKKCEAIIDSIQNVAMEVVRINNNITSLYIKGKNLVDEKLYNEKVEKLRNERDKLRETMLEMHSHELHLQIWGFEISKDYELNELNEALRAYISAINVTIKNSKQLLLTGEYIEVDNDQSKYKESLKLISTFMDRFNGSNFNEIFVAHENK